MWNNFSSNKIREKNKNVKLDFKFKRLKLNFKLKL